MEAAASKRAAEGAPAEGAPKAKTPRLSREEFSVSANEALSFRLAWSAEGIDEAPQWNAGFTHQVFREDETIWGYRGLEIVVTLHALTFHALVEWEHEGEAPPELGARDQWLERLREQFPAGLLTERAAFEALLPSLPARLTPDLSPAFSEVLREPAEGAGEARVRTVHALLQDDAAARAWHARLAPLVVFFIDGGTLLDTAADGRWELLVALRPREGGGEVVAGFATLYRFFAYPGGDGGAGGCRLRLSQLLVAQPHQRCGVASHLLAAARALALARGATDLTVEDPTDELQRLRELGDVRGARAIPAVRRAAAAAVQAAGAAGAAAPARLAALQLPRAAGEALRLELRLCRPQQRLVWEALLFLEARLQAVPPASAAALAFRALLEARLRGAGDGGPRAGAPAGEPPRKWVLDLDEAPDAEEAAGGSETPFPAFSARFLMARGLCGGEGRAQPAAVEEVGQEAAARAVDAMRELMGIELGRLNKLADKILAEPA